MGRLSEFVNRQGLLNILDFIYPPLCLSCGKNIEKQGESVCSACWDQVAVFDQPLCLNCRSIIEKGGKCSMCQANGGIPVFALNHYKDPLKNIIHRFKYDGFIGLGRKMAVMLVESHGVRLIELKADIIVPVPLHSMRTRLRGFNQSTILADIIGKRLKLAVDGKMVIKPGKTADQIKLNPEQRSVNLKGAFELNGEIKKGTRVIVVDDVITTGSTIKEIISVFKGAEARVVGIVAAALSSE
jgi:ComF family protein